MAIWRIAAAFAAMLSMSAASITINAAEISVLSTTASKEALLELVPMFERASGHRVNITYGGGVDMTNRVRGGIAVDLFIGPAEFTDLLLREGKLVAGSRVDFARSSTGVAVRAGATRPDIGTPEKLRAALLAAKSVSYSAGASGIHFVKVLERLGIAQQVQSARVAPRPGELVGAVVARGAAEIGVQQISELLPVEGIDILGPLPGELQQVIVYGASALPLSTQHEAAMEFVAFLRSGHAAPVIRKKGMEPL
jgi:molybdate transport system substrate-binding protein